LGMSVSVIFSSAWVKDVGRWVHYGPLQVDAFWMPAVTGLIFIPSLELSMYMLRHIPKPTADDIKARTDRKPMNRTQRRSFMRENGLGIILLIFGYTLLMGYRSVRDDFMVDILVDMGYAASEVDFGSMENWVGLAVIGILCVLWLFKSNRHAVWANMALIITGAVMVGVTTIMIQHRLISPHLFFILNGIGLYMAFVPYQSIFIDRLLASLQAVATASFLIAMGDAYGYLTVLGIFLAKDIYPAISGQELSWEQMLGVGAYVVMTIVPISMICMGLYFRPKLRD
jgi:hypothetical protein